jgi:hypothetical protein
MLLFILFTFTLLIGGYVALSRRVTKPSFMPTFSMKGTTHRASSWGAFVFTPIIWAKNIFVLLVKMLPFGDILNGLVALASIAVVGGVVVFAFLMVFNFLGLMSTGLIGPGFGKLIGKSVEAAQESAIRYFIHDDSKVDPEAYRSIGVVPNAIVADRVLGKRGRDSCVAIKDGKPRELSDLTGHFDLRCLKHTKKGSKVFTKKGYKPAIGDGKMTNVHVPTQPYNKYDYVVLAINACKEALTAYKKQHPSFELNERHKTECWKDLWSLYRVESWHVQTAYNPEPQLESDYSGSHGPGQINEHYWGKNPKDLECYYTVRCAMKKSMRILIEYGYPPNRLMAFRKYNGVAPEKRDRVSPYEIKINKVVQKDLAEFVTLTSDQVRAEALKGASAQFRQDHPDLAKG